MTEHNHRKKILVLMADTGFGHRSAATAVITALNERYGEQCEALMVNPLEEEDAPSFLRNGQSDYDRIARDYPSLNELNFRLADMALTSNLTEVAHVVSLYNVIAGLLKKHQPDVVVTTYPSYQYPLTVHRRLTGSKIPLVTVVTDLITLHRLWFNWDMDLCLVPTEEAADLAIQYKLDPQVVHVTGLPVNPLLAKPPDSKQALREALGWERDPFTILAVGSKRVEGLYDLLHVLNHAGHPIQLVAVAGGDDELYARLQDTEWHIPVRLYNFVEEMPNFLQAADCIMSKAGGLIVSESLACGLPMLIIQAIAGQETGNAQYIVEGQAGDMTEEPLQLLEVLCHWLLDDGLLYRQRVANAQRLGRADAAYQAADLIWELAQREEVEQRLRLPFDVEQIKTLLQEFSQNLPIPTITTTDIESNR